MFFMVNSILWVQSLFPIVKSISMFNPFYSHVVKHVKACLKILSKLLSFHRKLTFKHVTNVGTESEQKPGGLGTRSPGFPRSPRIQPSRQVSCGGHTAASCAQCVQENVAVKELGTGGNLGNLGKKREKGDGHAWKSWFTCQKFEVEIKLVENTWWN